MLFFTFLWFLSSTTRQRLTHVHEHYTCQIHVCNKAVTWKQKWHHAECMHMSTTGCMPFDNVSSIVQIMVCQNSPPVCLSQLFWTHLAHSHPWTPVKVAANIVQDHPCLHHHHLIPRQSKVHHIYHESDYHQLQEHKEQTWGDKEHHTAVWSECDQWSRNVAQPLHQQLWVFPTSLWHH
jgi:hypothetical protein